MTHHKAASLRTRFRDTFATEPRLFRAPGRVNLIGEHTDYNDGFVMPIAIDRWCWVAAAPRKDRTIVVESINIGQRASIEIDAVPRTTGTWIDYVAGVAAMLRGEGVTAGADLLVDSDVPAGAGLSSSAALEVAIAYALLEVSGSSLEKTRIARLCQRAENEVVGAEVGIMDQYVAVHAREGCALLLDCRTLEHRLIPLPADVRVVACNTMVKHSIATGEYNKRRAECRAAVATLEQQDPEVTALRDVDLPTLEATRERLDPLVFRRARHIVTENARVTAAAAALESGNQAALGPLMAESHHSLRDDFEVSARELDILVEIAEKLPGVVGARMTGGGFGGCTVNLVRKESVDAFREAVSASYEQSTGTRPDVYVTESAGGAERVDA